MCKINIDIGNVLIIGCGLTGRSCIKFFSRKKCGAIRVFDTRQLLDKRENLKKGFRDVQFAFGDLPEQWIVDADLVVVSPGVSKIKEIKKIREYGKKICTDLDIFGSETNVPLIGVTGSNGKSTVVTLVSEMLTAAGFYAEKMGNIGIPVLDALEYNKNVSFYVIELSSIQLENLLNIDLLAGVILNISENHIDQHGSMERYIAAKKRIYSMSELCIINRACKDVIDGACRGKRAVIFSCENYADDNQADVYLKTISDRQILMNCREKLLFRDEIKLRGQHNLENVMAAFSILKALEIPLNMPVINVVKKFSGLVHRCEFVCSIQGVVFFNDSKSTTPAATIAALESFKTDGVKNIILIAGGQSKNISHTVLKTEFEKSLKSLIIIGDDKDVFVRDGIDLQTVYYSNSMKQAVNLAYEEAEKGDIVLLSPACASFDWFDNFEDRGNKFKECVKTLFLKLTNIK